MASSEIRYLLFDIESIADGDLIAKVRYPDEQLTASEAVKKYQSELMEQTGREFIPYTYHIPVSVAIIKIREDLKIDDIVTLDDGNFRPHIITKDFWTGWRAYKMPTLISFNGRTFDIPLMELAAYRFGVPISDWFNLYDKSYEQKRNRFNQASHLDLQEVLTNYGATRLNGGLNLVAMILGRPGKMAISGDMVQELYENGEIKRINDYCRCDVLDTYFVFLRMKLLMGAIDRMQEAELGQFTHRWLEERSADHPIYAEYLAMCNEWENPFAEEDAVKAKGAG